MASQDYSTPPANETIVQGQTLPRMDVEYANIADENPSPNLANENSSLMPLAAKLELSDGKERRPPHNDRAWAIAFKINVLVTLISAAWFGSMAIEVLANGSMSGAGRRRLQDGKDFKDSGKCLAWLVVCG